MWADTQIITNVTFLYLQGGHSHTSPAPLPGGYAYMHTCIHAYMR